MLLRNVRISCILTSPRTARFCRAGAWEGQGSRTAHESSQKGYRMYVCLCRAVTDTQIRNLVETGAACIDDVSASLGVATCCGQCREHAESVIAACLPQFTDNSTAQSASLHA